MDKVLVRNALQGMIRATDDDSTPIIRRLARVQARAALANLDAEAASGAGEREAITRLIDPVLEQADQSGNTAGLWLFAGQWRTVRAALASLPPATDPGKVERPSGDALEPHLPESIEAAKRCGIQRSDWLTGWFVPWSPRNDNQNAEGPWADWVALAHAILAADAKALAALAAAPTGGEG